MREYNEDFDFGYIYTNVDDEEMIIIETDPMTIQVKTSIFISNGISMIILFLFLFLFISLHSTQCRQISNEIYHKT